MRKARFFSDRLVACRSMLVSLAACSTLLGCKGKPKTEFKPSDVAPQVHVTHPQTRTIVRTVEQPSFVESYERSSVYPKMTGYIEKWYVDIGDRVKRGQTLATLYVPELVEDFGTKKATVGLDQQRIDLSQKMVEVAQADVEAAQARLEEAQAILNKYQAEVERWQSEVDRLTREVEKGVVAPQILLESKNQLKSDMATRDAAQATIKKAEAELLSHQATLSKSKVDVSVAEAELSVAQSEARRLEALVSYLKLNAPFDGVVVARNANTFDFVLPATGDPTADRNAPYTGSGGKAAPIYVVERTDVVRVFVDVPEADANYVQPGSEATVLIQAFEDDPIAATVTRTAWALNVRSRTLRAEIDLPNTNSEIPADLPDVVHQSLEKVKLPQSKGKILPGMYAYGTVIIKRPNVLALPRTALDYEHGKTFYWAYQDGHSVRMEVRTGVSDDDWTEVTNRRALASNDRHAWRPVDGSEQAILGDLATLTDGGKVNVVQDDGHHVAQDNANDETASVSHSR